MAALGVAWCVQAQQQLTPQQRAQAFLAGRHAAGEQAGAARLAAARAQQAELAKQSQIQPMGGSGSVSTVWTAVGPAQVASIAYGDVTGRVTGIAVDPADATGNTVYVATTGGGVWKSTNAAGPAASVTFAPLTDELPVFNGGAAIASLSIGAVTVQPGGTGVVLAGTGDPNDALDSYYGSGILRSANGGQTWTLVQGSQDGVAGNHSFTGEGFAGFAWSTTTPGLVVAAVSQAAEGVVVNAGTVVYSVMGLYYSSDAGVTWQMATISDGSKVVQSAESTYTTTYSGNAATAVVWNPVRQMFYAAVRFHGYYQSADGVNWTRLTSQPGAGLTTTNCPAMPNATGDPTCPVFRGALAVNAATGDTFALTVDANNGDQGLYQDACGLSGSSCGNAMSFGKKLTATPMEAAGVIAQGDYNLALTAVANGTDTLLFAGTEDVYRCSIAAGCALRNTTNTDDGCATPAMVAPAQHALAAMTVAGAPLLYFGNDGGLWRSTDGVNEQGSPCAAGDASHFQDLNGGLGSLAEVVHFSQSPTDANTYIAGLGAMGSAATTAAATQSAWPQLSGGEGGYNAIDAVDPLNWYVGTGPGVSVNQCTLGGGCTAADFAVQAVIGAAQTDEDAALMDAPFLLDPALQSSVLVGTCRVWRGEASGGAAWPAANLISAILDGVNEPECMGSNGMVRSLAAGGAANGSGNVQNLGSEAVYAGLAGVDDGGGVKAGHLFGTTAGNTDSSTTVWSDLWKSPVTNDPANNVSAGDAQFNPGMFDVSSITVDAHDATGATAYATVMGFSGNGVSEPHVYRTTDAGAHWATITSNLPDAPANAVLVDPDSANTVYVAMDTGVYATTAVTSCVTPTVNCWNVMGSGLPNAPVTQLAAATGSAAGGVVTGMLVAGTYGRGIWQVPLLSATLVAQPQPAMQLSPTTLTFAAQQVGTLSAAQTITVTNTGNAPLTVSQVTATGDFTETDNCTTAAIAANASCTVQVSFLPSATGARSGSLTVYGNVTGGQAGAALSGTGLAPAAITLSPLTIAFAGQTIVGQTSAAMDLTVTNSGGVATALSAPVMTGDFAVSNNTCGAQLAAQAACGIAIVFTPTAAGARTGSIAMTDSAGTQTAALSGTGAAPATDALSPLTLTFAAQTVGTTSAAQTVTLTNSGDAALTLISTAVMGDFTAVNGCGASLAGHSACSISVAYVPRVTGAETGVLSVTDVNRTQTVALGGTGLAPAGVSLTPVTLSFGGVGVGLASAAQVVTLTNNGGSPLSLGSEAVSGDFRLTANTCGAALAAGAACGLTVVFAPTATGMRMGALTVTDSAANSPQTVPLTGMGVDFVFAVSGSSSQTVSSTGGTAGYGILLTPASGVSGTAALSCSGAPTNAVCTVAPTSVSLAGASALVQVTVTTAVPHGIRGPVALAALLVGLPLLLRRRRLRLLALCVLLSGCGWGRLVPADTQTPPTATPTPPGTYTLMVTAADGASGAQHSVPLTLIVQ